MKTYKSRGKHVGKLTDTGYYRTVRRSSKHLMVAMDAWAVDKAILDDLSLHNCKAIQLYDADEGVFYQVSLELFLEKGITKEFGYGLQLFLPRSYWTVKTPPDEDTAAGEAGQVE